MDTLAVGTEMVKELADPAPDSELATLNVMSQRITLKKERGARRQLGRAA